MPQNMHLFNDTSSSKNFSVYKKFAFYSENQIWGTRRVINVKARDTHYIVAIYL